MRPSRRGACASVARRRRALAIDGLLQTPLEDKDALMTRTGCDREHGHCRDRRGHSAVPFTLLATAALVATLGVACSRGGDAAPSGDAVRPVKTMKVAAADSATSRSFPGRVEATKRVELAFQVPGLLVDIPVTEGKRVKKGDLVARLREDEFRARLTALEGQLDQARAVLAALRVGERQEERLRREAAVRAAEARLANARADFNRFAELVTSNAVSRAEYERAEAAFKVAEEEYKSALQLLEKGTQAREEDITAQEASVRSLEGRVDEARIQLADCTLAAPYDGVVAEVFVQRQQTVRAGQPIVRYQNVDEIDVAVDVPEAVMATDIRSPLVASMDATFSSVPGRSFPGARARSEPVRRPDDADLPRALRDARARRRRDPSRHVRVGHRRPAQRRRHRRPARAAHGDREASGR
jgi:multidrug efflux pump subunit AcrA (membrane-fusion protein)